MQKKLWPLFSGHGVFLQTLNFPVKFQRKDRDRGSGNKRWLWKNAQFYSQYVAVAYLRNGAR